MSEMQAGILQSIETPDGMFTVISNESQQVLASGWTSDQRALLERIHPTIRPTELIAGETDAADAVTAYYAGDLSAAMRVPVAQHGTEMQMLGWAALRRIPPGEPLSYVEFAALIGREGAVRPAASICARNAPALFVPCHRVLRSDGTLGGFAWGVEVKRSLLDRESLQDGLF